MPFAGYHCTTGAMKLVWAATAGAIGCNLGSLSTLPRLGLRRPPFGQTLWSLDPDRPASMSDKLYNIVGTLQSSLGEYHHPHFHRVACWNRSHAARQIPSLYFFRVVALVPGSGLLGVKLR